MRTHLFFQQLVIAITLVACAASCARKSSDTPSYPDVGDELFDASVRPDQRALLENDLAMLAENDALDASEDAEPLEDPLQVRVREIGDLGDESGRSLTRWLKLRVRRVLGDDFAAETQMVTLASGGPYAPTLEGDASWFAGPTDEVSLLMTNLGAAIYRSGRERSVRVGLRVAGGGVIKVTSPRVGVIQIRKGLFSRNFRAGDDLASPANSILRLSTLFHEARHSDGHAERAGLPHVTCPPGHALSGKPVCDDAANGAYALSAGVLRKLLERCKARERCEPGEQYALIRMIAEFEMRVIEGSPDVDARAERIQ